MIILSNWLEETSNCLFTDAMFFWTSNILKEMLSDVCLRSCARNPRDVLNSVATLGIDGNIFSIPLLPLDLPFWQLRNFPF